MAFLGFGKSSGEKHSFIEVIRYDGPNDILVWKFPNEDFNTNTQLIVGPSQEAIFVKGGQVLERFITGTYTLNTKNYPFIRSLVGLVTGGVSPFSCTVYYINKVVSMGMIWGTDAPIAVVDPIYNVPVSIRSYGDFSLQVENGRMMMEKLVGQTQGLSHQEIEHFFSGMMASQIRGVISRAMLGNQLSVIGVDAHLAEMSAMAAEALRPVFEPYGVRINHFSIASITAPDMESIMQKARDMKEHSLETDETVADTEKLARAKDYENRTLNVTEQEKWIADMGKKLAGNPGPMMGGEGGIGFPGMVGGNIVQPSAAGTAEIARMLMHESAGQPKQPEQDVDGVMPGGMFGMMEEVEPTTKTEKEPFEARAKKLKFLMDNAMITEVEYRERLNQLMSEI